MWIAKTTIADGIGGVVFATVIFLILFGIISLVKWFFRLISGKQNPSKMETVALWLETDITEYRKQHEDYEAIRVFALYLHSKLAEQKIGQLTGANRSHPELVLYFAGPDASRIWDLLACEVTEYSPTKPLRVLLKRTNKMGGTQILENIPWRPVKKLHFQIPSEIEIPEKWLRLSNISQRVAISGILGLFGWKLLRLYHGMTENEFMETTLGMVSAYIVGLAVISGLTSKLICMRRLNAITRIAGFYDVESSTSNTLKYVLLTVIAIFGLVFLLVW